MGSLDYNERGPLPPDRLHGNSFSSICIGSWFVLEM